MREENLERELDAALARYASVEPRDGLEQRVLANLRSQQVKQSPRWKSWRVWATVVALMGMATATLLISGARTNFGRKTTLKPSKQEVANTEIANQGIQVHVNSGTHVDVRQSMNRSKRPAVASSISQHRPPGRALAVSDETIPKLAKFPAAEPLSEQEKLLVRYVQDDPERAELIAEATALAERSTVTNTAEGSAAFQSSEEER